MKYTKGKWNVNAAALTVDADGRPVADVRCSEIADEAIDANARLIAAAPDLLAACKLALEVLRDQHAALAPELHGGICPDREAMLAIEAAIARAEGAE